VAINSQVHYYRDRHPTPEDLCRTTDLREPPIAPEVAVFKRVSVLPAQKAPTSSWQIHPPEKPPPAVVFEVGSSGTSKNDIQVKPGPYVGQGSRKYFYYGPQAEAPADGRRLPSWRTTGGGAGNLFRDHN
jgi:Uma2 family endonuclease